MARIPGVRTLFRLPSSERRVAGDVEDEITFHLEERTQELIRQGMDPAAARAEALNEFGDVREARAELEQMGRRRVRHERRASWWSDLRQDIGFGLRSARGAPLFSLLAIVTLALGIGANSAVFGVVKSVLLDSLPYADADRLVRIYTSRPAEGEVGDPLSAATVTETRDRQRSFTEVSYFMSHTPDAVLGSEQGARVVNVAWVEPQLLRTLGVAPAIGRPFHAEDAQDTARVVLLTHAAWQRVYGGDTGVLGRQVEINGLTREVVGVLPRDFAGPMGTADFYFPLTLSPYLANPANAVRSRFLGAVGRLAPGVSRDAAAHDIEAIGAALARETPADRGGLGLASVSLRRDMAGDTRTPLLVLLASAALVLLIACANLAGALLSRTIARRKEFAVRVALGAGRGRLVRQLLTESTLLAAVGGVAGLLLAWLGLTALRRTEIPVLPPYADLSLDTGVVLVTALIALGSGIAFGVAPALSVGRADPQATLRDETRGSSESRQSRRLRGALVVGQIALCVSLLVGAGLLARSLWALGNEPLGLEAGGVLSATVQLPYTDYGSPEARVSFRQEYAGRLDALPGVSAVADVSALPTDVGQSMSFTVQGAPRLEGGEPFVLYATTSDDYFRLLRIPLLEGRTFGPQDHLEAPPVVVISESMARRYWPGGDALGAWIRMGPDPEAAWKEVVGIVGDVRNELERRDAEPMAYRSSRQDPWHHPIFLVRTTSDPMALVRAVERELAALDPGLPLDRARPLEVVVSAGLAPRRLPLFMMMGFGVIALLLASIGVYAMFASMVAAREREFGVRMALGSHPRAIAGLVLRQGSVWMGAGLALGTVGVVLVGSLLRDLLYGVSPLDPLTLGVTVGTLGVCGAVALLAPIRRAARVDPATALRS